VCIPVYMVIIRELFQALAALGLKTGGTPQQRAERLFLTKVSAS
jgi:hypothetical protein